MNCYRVEFRNLITIECVTASRGRIRDDNFYSSSQYNLVTVDNRGLPRTTQLVLQYVDSTHLGVVICCVSRFLCDSIPSQCATAGLVPLSTLVHIPVTSTWYFLVE